MNKLFATILTVLFAAVFCLSVVNCVLLSQTNVAIDDVTSQSAVLRVEVLDLSGNAVQNALIKVVECNTTAKTDDSGQTELTLSNMPQTNLNWCGLTVTVSRSGYVNTAVINCVVYYGRTRTLKVRMYDDDGTLPYVCYVECPPEDYINGLFD